MDIKREISAAITLEMMSTEVPFYCADPVRDEVGEHQIYLKLEMSEALSYTALNDACEKKVGFVVNLALGHVLSFPLETLVFPVSHTLTIHKG